MSIRVRCTQSVNTYDKTRKITVETTTFQVEGTSNVSLPQPLQIATADESLKGVIKAGELYDLGLKLVQDPPAPVSPPTAAPAADVATPVAAPQT